MSKCIKYFLIVIIIALMLPGCTKHKRTDFDELTRGIYVKTAASTGPTDDLIIYVANDNKYDVSNLTFNVEFYDSKKGKVDEETVVFTAVQAGTEAAQVVSLPYDNNGETIKYDNMRSTLVSVVKKADGLKLYTNKIEAKYEIADEQMQITLKNNAGVKFDYLTLAVLYMENNAPIDADILYIFGDDFDQNGVYTEKIPIVNNMSDEIKLIVNDAYVYDD